MKKKKCWTKTSDQFSELEKESAKNLLETYSSHLCIGLRKKDGMVGVHINGKKEEIVCSIYSMMKYNPEIYHLIMAAVEMKDKDKGD